MLPRACSLKHTWWKGHVERKQVWLRYLVGTVAIGTHWLIKTTKKNIRNEQTIACTLCKIQYLVHSNSIYILKQQQLKLLLEQQ